MAGSTSKRGGFESEPNLTPMIDVLLVLLIIFMVIIPMGRKAFDVQLPDPTASSRRRLRFAGFSARIRKVCQTPSTARNAGRLCRPTGRKVCAPSAL